MRLKTGLLVVRNKKAGNGQGSTVRSISDKFAENVLEAAVTNIVLLVGNVRGIENGK